MELEDEEHKKLLCDKDEVLTECHQEIENLKSQLLVSSFLVLIYVRSSQIKAVCAKKGHIKLIELML